MKKMNKLFLFGITFLAFVLASCKIGLGEALDLTGPDVEITYPTMRQSVNENFTISGTAYDNNDVKKLTVTVDGNEWKNEDGVWTFKANGSSSYVPYADATWEIGSDKKVKWQIRNVNITSGRKLLTVVAVDGEGNTSANSQKTVTIFFDNDPPKVIITAPNIKCTNFDGENGIKTMYSALTDYKQLQVVNNVLTGGFTVSGVTTDDSTVNYVRLFIKKVDKDNGEASDFIERNLVLADSGQTFVDPISNDTLRSWEVEITDADLSSLDDDKHYLQIATQSCDNAGNADVGIDVHGYVVLWKAADHPWLTVNLSSDENFPTDVYSGASCQGTAFDNVQVQKVLLTIEKQNGSSWEKYKDYTDKEIPVKVDAEDVSQTLNFQFNYPSEVAVYRTTLKAVDTKGNESDPIVSYINVMDMTFPSIKIEPITNPFGDAAGNFTIKVTALDETGVKSIKYRICTESNDKTTYSDKTNGNWDNATNVKVTLNPTQTGTDDTGGFLRLKYDVEYKLNLFNDLNIGMDSNKLEQTTFIFLVEDEQGNRSLTKFVLPADVNPPEVTLKKVGSYDADLKTLSAFFNDFELSGTWSDDSFDAWKTNSASLAKGKPNLTVKLLGEELDGVNMNNDGTWNVTVPLGKIMQYGSVVGAIDIEVSIMDIGGATTTVQKGYQIDTNAPRLEYTSCDVPSGTYTSGKDIVITLHFNREVDVTGTPTLSLNNGQIATYTGYHSGDKKKLDFTFKAANDTPGADYLTITGGSGTITAAGASDLKYERFSTEVTGDLNKCMGKEIRIITSGPTYKEHSWDNTKKELTIKFNGSVTANSGTITIIQDESNLLVPAYLTKDEYNNMPTGVQSYYEEGTLGASESFAPDLTTKYILKYSTNTNDETLKGLYIATGSHKRSINILSENVMRTENDGVTTFVLSFGALPCKGASYTFDIPAGLVKNAAGTTNAADNGKTITNVGGIEVPVIRIYKPQQTITGCSASSAGSVEHALSTTFKIDCRTPGVTLNYSYDCLVPKVCTVTTAWGQSGSGASWQEEWYMYFAYDDNVYTTRPTSDTYNEKTTIPTGKPKITPTKKAEYSKGSTSYTSNAEIPLGKNGNADIGYQNGLTYQITATASKTGETAVNAYDVAYRTTMHFTNTGALSGIQRKDLGYWNYNNNAAMFLRGGENYEGANATSGLPSSWDINEKDKAVMLKSAGDNAYYFTTWNISVDTFYYQILGCLVDGTTNTANGAQGPSKSIYMQNGGLVHHLPETPIGKGEYIVYDYSVGGSFFDIGIPGKVMNHR